MHVSSMKKTEYCVSLINLGYSEKQLDIDLGLVKYFEIHVG